MSEYVRGPIWAGEEARAAWEDKLRRAALLWSMLERESVFAGMRSSALLMLTLEEFVELQRRCVGSVRLIALAKAGLGSGGYTSGTAQDGTPGIRAALTTAEPEEWLRAWDLSDNERIGQLLGFPACCRAFFGGFWNGVRIDPTVDQAAATVDGPAESNTFLRWLGLRLVPHLPCRFDCAESAAIGRRFVQLAVDLGHRAEASALLTLLSMPTTYSSLHGAGYVKTPAFRIEFSSDPYPAERRLDRAGVEGIEIPEPSVRLATRIPGSAEDNGFASAEAMASGHVVLMAAAGRLTGLSVLDLGSGDGTLLARCGKAGARHTLGVEGDADRAARGRRRNGVPIVGERLEAWLMAPTDPGVFDLAFLNPIRILELPEADRGNVLDRLRLRTRGLVLYTYEAGRAFGEVCSEAGLPVPPRIVYGAPGSPYAAGRVAW